MLRARARHDVVVRSGGIAPYARDSSLVSLDTRLLLREDITRERVVPGRGGRARPHAGAGLGVTVAEDVLARHTQRTRLVEA